MSTLGVKREKDFFMQGYNEMLRRINPQAIICYCEPFPEMKGNVIVVDYAKTNNLTSSKMFMPATKFMPSNMSMSSNMLKHSKMDMTSKTFIHSSFSMSSTKFKIIEDNSVYKIGISEMPYTMLTINAPHMLNLNGSDKVAGMGSGGGRVPMGYRRRNTPRNNQRQNKQVNDVIRKLKLSKKQQRELHDLIHGQGMSYQEILQFSKEWFDK